MSVAMPLPIITPQPRTQIRVRFEDGFLDSALIEGLHKGQFTVHGETHSIGSPVNWCDNPSDDIEWQIVLHKFFHAPALVQHWLDSGEDRHIALLEAHIRGWTKQIQPGFIAADVTGRRIRNWVYALALLDGAWPELADRMVASIREQVNWLRDNLHPARNHRTLELFAIYIAGVWLDEAEWNEFALAELLHNARLDFLPDGAHVELSSHYHCIALRNFIEAMRLADDNDLAFPLELRGIITGASHFAHMLHKPDGNIPALSDADVGDYREMLGPSAWPELIEDFHDSGYVIMRNRAAQDGDRNGHYLVLDCGDIGAGNHGHLDCLSFEFAALGRSMIVDPGRYSYHEGGDFNWRAAFRQTRAHNLVQVDGLEQTHYRQGPKRMKIDGPAPSAGLIAQYHHSNWRHIHARSESAQYAVRHDRHIVAHDDGWWVVFDRMTSDQLHLYEALFQLEPAALDHAHFIECPTGQRNLLAPNLLIMPRAESGLNLSFEQAWVSPRYGEKHCAPRLVCAQSASNGWFATLLLPFDGGLPDMLFSTNETGFTVNGQQFSLDRDGSC
jgi:Heparinase II/III-like protein/Heparinase II/III N-terminus